MLAGILGMLLGVCRMFLALCVVAFAMLFGRSAMRFGGILVMFGCLIVLFSSHGVSPVIVHVYEVQVYNVQVDWVSIGSGAGRLIREIAVLDLRWIHVQVPQSLDRSAAI
jgi:hypothetical protein